MKLGKLRGSDLKKLPLELQIIWHLSKFKTVSFFYFIKTENMPVGPVKVALKTLIDQGLVDRSKSLSLPAESTRYLHSDGTHYKTSQGYSLTEAGRQLLYQLEITPPKAAPCN